MSYAGSLSSSRLAGSAPAAGSSSQDVRSGWSRRWFAVAAVAAALVPIVGCASGIQAETSRERPTIDGVSLVANFRSQFQEIMTNGGIDKLLQLLNDKNAANDK